MNTLSAETAAAFDKLLEPSQRSDAPGYVVGVSRNNQTIYRRATGLASVELAVANTVSTRMRIGSVTKQFTGLAVMLLVEDGKLDIDLTVRHYLPELAGPNGSPTLRQLLNHTSGVRDALESVAFFLTEGLFPQIPAGLTHQWSSRFSDSNFEPGTAWCYSNYGYMLLSLVIERASGLTLAEFFRQRLFEPLGMVDSELFPNDMELSPGLAASHIRKPDGRYRRGIYPCEELVGGGGIVSTVDDMLRWAANLRQPQLGSRASWDEMLRAPRFSNGTEYSYGFGIKRQLHRGVELLWHSGSTIGSTAVLLSFPAQSLDIAIMSNRSDSDPSGIAIKIADLLLADVLGAPKVHAEAAGREALLGSYYSPQSRRVFTIRMHDKKLLFAINAVPEGLLREEDGALISDSSAGELSIRHAPSSTVSEIDVTICGDRETYTRLPDAAPKASALAAEMVGEYRLADFDTPVQITFLQDVLHLDLRSRYNPCRVRLTPFGNDVFLYTAVIAGTPFSSTLTLERRAGAVSGFFFNTQKSRNLRFSRSA
jgi:D-aminopeptidase